MFKQIAVLVLLLATAAYGNSGKAYEMAHKTTHEIEETTILDTAKCSATAVGPHALLTASHCEQPTDALTVDGNEVLIKTLYRDNLDHTIYILDTTFDSYARIAQKEHKVGEDVFVFGNPGELFDIMRKGYIAKVSPTAYIYELDGFYGDSGSGVFNKDGEVVGVLSAVAVQKEASGDATIKLAMGFILNFKSEVLEGIAQ